MEKNQIKIAIVPSLGGIDPHGIPDCGYSYDGLKESNITDMINNKINYYLSQFEIENKILSKNYEFDFTIRELESYLDGSFKENIFLSIHNDWKNYKNISDSFGYNIEYSGYDPKNILNAKSISKKILKNISEGMRIFYEEPFEKVSNQLKKVENELHSLPRVISIIINCGYINGKENWVFKENEWIDCVAISVVKGFCEYLGISYQTSIENGLNPYIINSP